METTGQEKHIPRKPIQVTYAFYLILGAIAVTLVGSMITRVVSEQASLSELLAGTASVGLVLLLPLWLAFKINAGRNWARWGFVIFAVLGLFDTLNVVSSFSDHPIQSTYYVISVGLSFLAVFLLFQRPANVWFKVIKIHESIPEKPQQAAETTDKPSDEIGFSSSITQEETAVAEKEEDAKAVVESEARPLNNTARNAKIWLIISQAISVLLLILWFFTLIAAQGAEEPWEFLLAFSLLLHPVTATICSIVAWILYAKARYRLAAIVTSVPLLPFAILFSSWIYHELVKYL